MEKLKQEHRSEWIRHYDLDASSSLWTNFQVNWQFPNTSAGVLVPGPGTAGSFPQAPLPLETNVTPVATDGKLFVHQFMSHSLCHYMREQHERIQLLESKLALAERRLERASDQEVTTLISPSSSIDQPLIVRVDTTMSPHRPDKEPENVDIESQKSPILFFTPTVTASSMSPPQSQLTSSSQLHRVSSPSLSKDVMRTPEKITKGPGQTRHLFNDSDSDSGHSTQTSPSLMNGSSFRRPRHLPSKQSKENQLDRKLSRPELSLAVVKSPKKLLLCGLDDNPIQSPKKSKTKLQQQQPPTKPKVVSTDQWISVDKSVQNANRSNQKKSSQSKLTNFPRSVATNLTVKSSTSNRKVSRESVSGAGTDKAPFTLDDDLDDFCQVPSINPRSRSRSNASKASKRLIQTKLDINKLFDVNGARGKQEDLTNSEEYFGGARSNVINPDTSAMETVDATLKPKIGMHSNSPGGVKRRKVGEVEPLTVELSSVKDNDDGHKSGRNLAELVSHNRKQNDQEKMWEQEVQDVHKVFGNKDFEETYFNETSQLAIKSMSAPRAPIHKTTVTEMQKPQPKSKQVQESGVTPLSSRPKTRLQDPEEQEKKFNFRSKRSPPNIGNDTMDVIAGFDKLPGDEDSPDVGFRYKPDKAARKKVDRDKLPGVACDMCRDYYNEIASQLNPADIAQIMNKCSKHREKYARNAGTPPDYWRTDFPSTAECIEKGYLHIETPDPFMDPKMKNKISRY